MIQPIPRVNFNAMASMLEKLDGAAYDSNVSRQAVIRTLMDSLAIAPAQISFAALGVVFINVDLLRS